MSNVIIRVNGTSAGDGFLVAPDAGSTFPVPLNLSTNDGTTVDATIDASPNGAGVALPAGTISIGPAGVDIPIHATMVSNARGDTVINVHVGGETTSFALTAITNPEVWFRGRFEARFATDDDWYNDPKGTWGAGNDGVNPLGNGNEGPGWTWVLEGEPDFVPADSVASNPDKPVGRVVRFNNPVALRSHVAPVVTTVNEIRGTLADSTTQAFTAGDPILGALVNLGPNTYFASNDPADPNDPPPAETFPAGFEVMALFEFQVDGFMSGRPATLADRPKANGFVSPLPDSDEKTAIGFVDLATFASQRLALLQSDYNALSASDQTGTPAGRNLKRRIDHLTGAKPQTLPQGWDGKEEYTGHVNAGIAFPPNTSSVISYLGGFTDFVFFGRFFTFHSDELCGHVHGSLKANTLARVVRDCVFITDRSTFGKDEIDAMLHQSSPAVVAAAFYVEVDGFRPDELGITSADLAGTPSVYPTITPAPGVSGMTIGDAHGKPSALLAQDPTLTEVPQRFTWVYPITFTDTTGFVPGGQVITLTAAIATVSGSAQIQLTEAANVYEVDGRVSWLSADTRVFMAKANESWFNAPALGTSPAAASSFIKAIIGNLNSGNTGGQTFDSLPADENGSALALYQKDHSNTPVFNFALARVRYRARVADASNVRVFFRLCPALSVSVDYDAATTYKRSAGLNPAGQPIPVLGVQGGHLVTIPFFADERVNAAAVGMGTQKDQANAQVISHDSTGAEVEAYFGCVLDINQPSPAMYPLNPAGEGPYSGDLKSVLELVRNEHQCLLVEIAFDPDPITGHPSPAMSDKLAQRNLSLVPSDNPGDKGSHRIPSTFELKPTPPRLTVNEPPDELMIDWGNTPAGSMAQIYLPSVQASEILQMASRMYFSHGFTIADPHTLQCKAESITYVPIPSGIDVNHAGLLTVDLPPNVRRGQLFRIVVRQITNAKGRVLRQQPVIFSNQRLPENAAAATALKYHEIRWRRVRGTFQISIPVGTAAHLLPPEETKLSVFRYILQSIPKTDRWHPVFERYVNQIGERVQGFGGNPVVILPSPNGDGKPAEGPEPGEDGRDRLGFTGKVIGLNYDRFGDFEGFHLLTESGCEEFFWSRERKIERLVYQAWVQRMLITVFALRHEPRCPVSIVLRQAPRFPG